MRKFNYSIPVYGNALIIALLAIYLGFMPFGILVKDLRDPALTNGEIPDFAFRWHRSLSGRYEDWARYRVATAQAAALDTTNISGTEWPIFSAVFYLWSTEELQAAWEADPTLAPEMPTAYARGAIEAAAALVADPNHATWVKLHWGEDYLSQENLFYRMLLISGLTSYQKLLDDDQYADLLADQVDSLANELDASPYGLLDDYPGQCYPIDILPAIAAIRRADAVLGSDHREFAERAIRAFSDTRLDSATDLPAYIADPDTGIGYGPARGVGISYGLIWAPELWPETAQEWYTSYDEHFWQSTPFLSGVREFSRYYPHSNWWVDVDAGPVLAGYGTTASAFGIGAMRANGRLDRAYPLSAEALVAAWPLPDGTLLGARLLSNLSDAPYVGEVALLFNFTRRPVVTEITTPADPRLPGIVYLALAIYLLASCLGLGFSVSRIRRWRRISNPESRYAHPRFQLLSWLGLLLFGIMLFYFNFGMLAVICVGMAQCFPIKESALTKLTRGR